MCSLQPPGFKMLRVKHNFYNPLPVFKLCVCTPHLVFALPCLFVAVFLLFSALRRTCGGGFSFSGFWFLAGSGCFCPFPFPSPSLALPPGGSAPPSLPLSLGGASPPPPSSPGSSPDFRSRLILPASDVAPARASQSLAISCPFRRKGGPRLVEWACGGHRAGQALLS